jgi:hypothetical protein
LGNFPLGTIVRRRKETAPPTFAVTDFIFHVHGNSAAPQTSTLAYLCETGARALPADPAIARTKLASSWLRPEQVLGQQSSIGGILAIRRDLFFDNFLIPRLTAALGVSPTGNGFIRSFTRSQGFDRTETNIVKSRTFGDQGYQLSVTLDKGSQHLTLSGKAHANVNIEQHLLLTNIQSAAMRVAGERTLQNAILTLRQSAIGQDFNVAVTLSAFSFSPLVKTQEEFSGIGAVADALTNVRSLLEHAVTSEVDQVSNQLRQGLNNLAVDLSHHTFIPPGGGVFTFQNVHFSDVTGDLIFDVLYQAP